MRRAVSQEPSESSGAAQNRTKSEHLFKYHSRRYTVEKEINYEWFILPNFSEWGQFSIMKVGNIVPYIYSIIPVISILTINIGFSE